MIPHLKQYTDETEHEKIIKSFKLPFDAVDENGLTGDVGIIVVQSMLLTGFDAPIEQVMYLDTVIKTTISFRPLPVLIAKPKIRIVVLL